MKRKIALVAATLATLTLSACGGSNPDSSTTSGSSQQQTVLKVGMECGYAPFNWTQDDDSNGAIAISNVPNGYANGYDVQIAKRVANYLGMTLEIYAYEWDTLIPAVQSGALDAIAAGMSPTEERKEEVSFSSNYYQSNLVVITKKNSPIANAATLADVDVSGVKIAAQPGTFHEKALKEQTSNCQKVDNLDDFSDMQMALSVGAITGYISEEPTAMAFCSNPDSEYTYVDLKNNVTGFVTAEGDTAIAMGFKKGNTLVDSVSTYLNTLTASDWSTLMNQMVAIAPAE